jgi:hypothetical protein
MISEDKKLIEKIIEAGRPPEWPLKDACEPPPIGHAKNLKVPVKCPKCKRHPREIVEFVTASTTHQFENGVWVDGIHEPGECGAGWRAKCTCGHIWRLSTLTGLKVNDYLSAQE